MPSGLADGALSSSPYRFQVRPWSEVSQASMRPTPDGPTSASLNCRLISRVLTSWKRGDRPVGPIGAGPGDATAKAACSELATTFSEPGTRAGLSGGTAPDGANSPCLGGAVGGSVTFAARSGRHL